MPRTARIRSANTTFHIVQRGNNRNTTFFHADDFHTYTNLLVTACDRYGCKLHAYVLMTNHVHLLMTSGDRDSISKTMQYTSGNYVRTINDRDARTGSLWEGRFRSSPVEADSYCLACYRYIELNPVRAGMVATPGDYRWSSYLENIGVRKPPIVQPHISFQAIAKSSNDRIQHYVEMVGSGISEITLDAIRRATKSSSPFGTKKFAARWTRAAEKVGSS